MTTIEVLRKAREVLVTRGWHQGGYASDRTQLDTCSVCAVGAIYVAVCGKPFGTLGRGLVHAAAGLLADAVGYRGSLFGEAWNDVHGRTFEEVLAAFDAAIAAAEARVQP